MSDDFQSVIVTQILSLDERERVVERVLHHLQQDGVVTVAAPGTKTWSPSSHMERWPGAKALGVVADDAATLRSLRGPMTVVLGDGPGGRGVLALGEGSGSDTRCPRCDAVVEALSWGDAVDAWYRGAPGLLVCARCKAAVPVDEWRYVQPVGFGCAAFTWWNWPTLDETFEGRVAELIGYPSVIVRGKL